MTLQDDIAKWDAKAVEHIQRVYVEHSASRGFAGRLITMASDSSLERGATWLLKHHLEQGEALTKAHAKKLYEGAPTLQHWEARLHLLQMMPMIPVPKPCAEAIEVFLHACLDEENKFVRAWAYSGYADLASAHPEYQEEARAILADAMEHEEAASVRARVRQVVKRFAFPTE